MQPADLKAIRDALGMSQQQMADALGMSRKAITEMESGKARIEVRTGLAARFLRAQRAVDRIDRGMVHLEDDDAGNLAKDVTQAFRALKAEERDALLQRLLVALKEDAALEDQG